MQDKLSLTFQTQTALNELSFTNTQSTHPHHVPNNQRSSSARKPDGPSSGKSRCFLMSIPDESLTHITTFVDDPPSLFALSRVNRRLRDHVADDNTWYRAFAFHFLGVGPESEPEHDKRLMLRRSESTWKKEFVFRFNLARRWERSRNSTLSYQPHYWGVSSMHLLENVSLMTSNLQYGIVTRSFPLTGKILRGHLDASGTTNGLGIGNPNEEFSPNVSCTALSSCGGTGRIAWGFRNGEVAATSAPRVMDSNRSAARYVRCQVEDEHTGQVRCVLFAGKEDELVVSGSTHGEVKLWDAKRMHCLWTGFGKKADVLLPDPCIKIEFCGAAGVLVAALESGIVVVWWGFQLEDDGLGSQTLTHDIQEFRIDMMTQPVSSDKAVIDTLFVDPNSSPSKVSILVHHVDQRHFLRLMVDLPSALVTYTRLGDGPLGPLTSLTPHFAIQNQSPAISTLTPLTPVATGTPSLTIAQTADRIVSREPSFVLAGDSLGTVCVWNWDAEGSFVTRKDAEQPLASRDALAQVNSSRKWEAHDDGAVCAIEVSSAVIVTGSTRGTLKVWDALTLTLLRTFQSPVSKPSVTGEWDPVGQIIVRGDLLVASVGSRILVWQAGVVVSDKKGKGKHAGRPKGRATGSSLNKWQQQIELNRDIRESQRLLDDERAQTQRVRGRERAQLSTLNQLGLDEREAVEYLLMLSREEEDQRRASEIQSGPPSSGSGEDSAIATIANDDTEGVFTLEEHSDFGHPRPMAQDHGSPTLMPSPGTSYALRHSPSSSVPRAAPSDSNSKVQVSPPFLPELTEAGLSMSPLRLATTRSGGASPVPMGTRRTSGLSMSTSSTSLVSSSGDADQFPVVSSSSGTPNRPTSSIQLAGSWTRGSPSSSFDSARSGGNIWTRSNGRQSSSTSSSTSVSLSPALLAQNPDPGDGLARSRDEEEDDELKFVLELSLAEARSRGEL